MAAVASKRLAGLDFVGTTLSGRLNPRGLFGWRLSGRGWRAGVQRDFIASLERSTGASARLPAEHEPLLLVVVDTEEEFDWSQPHRRENTQVSAIAAQTLAQEVLRRHRIVPTYVVDYPVATAPEAAAVLGGFLQKGECRIGAHLHPWVNPPHEETVTAVNSYPGNLPPALERAKLKALTEAIDSAFEARPVIYKAGRYGVGPNTAAILEELGYLIDVSVVPYTNFGADGGPDFSRAAFQPAWFGEQRRLLEIPLSCGFYGMLRAYGPQLFPHASNGAGMRLRLPAILARCGLLERIRLTPEGVDLAANIRLARSLFEQGCRIFTYTYHSPSLVPGCTPYVRSQADLDAFLNGMDRFFAYFREDLGGRPSDPLEIYSLLQETSSRGGSASATGRPDGRMAGRGDW